MNEQFDVNTFTGSASLTVPLPLTEGRSGFGPRMSVSHGYGTGNGPFGWGWQFSLPAVSRTFRKHLPTYRDETEADVFSVPGAGDVVPIIDDNAGEPKRRVLDRSNHRVYPYISCHEQAFLRIERWVEKTTGETHWRVRSSDNVTSVYGLRAESRIADPDDPRRIHQWMIERVFDDKGNVNQMEYKSEDFIGVDRSSPQEAGRKNPGAQKYLKRIRYGNTEPHDPVADLPSTNGWLFETVFDYGEHDLDHPTPAGSGSWATRSDPFSSYRSGFDIRTYRLCRRVLMFHHFPELGAEPGLTGSTTFEYEENQVATRLTSIQYTGYRRKKDSSGYDLRPMPPLTFEYSRPVYNGEVLFPEEAALNGLPQGIDGISYRWLDLFGEGVSGVLSETRAGWYYKRNLGRGRFGPPELVPELPNTVNGHFSLSDLDRNGSLDVTVTERAYSGFNELDCASEQWQPFQIFCEDVELDHSSALVQRLDLNGDGNSELIFQSDDHIQTFVSHGKKGFELGERVRLLHESDAPPRLGIDGYLDVTLSDMTGDGLPDLVQVSGASIRYWPNCGHGQFGNVITMTMPPEPQRNEQLDLRRVRFADISGNGCADMIYLGGQGIEVWLNESGNSFKRHTVLDHFPQFDDLEYFTVADFLADGSKSLVYSHPFPSNGDRSIRHLPLSDGKPVNLLTAFENGMGQRIEIEHGSSAEFFLEARSSGNPWRTKLSNHVTVVKKLVTRDLVTDTSQTTRYVYRDGYYDDQDHSFKGFGLVEQYDAESFTDSLGIDRTDFVEPLRVRNWYYTCADPEDLRQDWYDGDPDAVTNLPIRIEKEEELDATQHRRAKGAVTGNLIRREVFANGVGASPDPYRVDLFGYDCRLLQSHEDEDRNSFYVFERESLTYQYEQDPADPRVSHEVTMRVNKDGAAVEKCSIAYPRRPTAQAEPEQLQDVLILETLDAVSLNTEDTYRLNLPVQVRSWELRDPGRDFSRPLTFPELDQLVSEALQNKLLFSDDPPAQAASARLLSSQQQFYWDDDARNVLLTGEVGRRALIHHSETAVLTDDLVEEAFDGRATTNDMQTLGRYQKRDDYWWNNSGITHHHDQSRFFLAKESEDALGHVTSVSYDVHDLLITQTRDPLGKTETTDYDYHTLQPLRKTNANDNITEIGYDPLGVPVVVARFGTELDESGQPLTRGAKPLAEFQLEQSQHLTELITNPARFAQSVSTFLWYDLFAWKSRGEPIVSVGLARKSYASDGIDSDHVISITYRDGFYRTLQTRSMAGPGTAWTIDANGQAIESEVAQRWLISGTMTYNNKQLPLEEFEPLFLDTHEFVSNSNLDSFGVATKHFYDALGREVRTEFPDGTFTRSEITPWRVRSWDANDTIKDSLRHMVAVALPADHPEHRAVLATEAHHDTPESVLLDSQGRTFLQRKVLADGSQLDSRTGLDIAGATRSLTDQRGVEVLRTVTNMLGEELRRESVDAGTITSFMDTAQREIRVWTATGEQVDTEFDTLSRPVKIKLTKDGQTHLLRQYIYGENLPETEGKARNLRGIVHETLDGSGKTTIEAINFEGGVIRSSRRLVKDYKNLIDWSANPELKPDMFESRRSYNGLGQLSEHRKPDGSVTRFEYNLQGAVTEITVDGLPGAQSSRTFLTDRDYNARGQMVHAELGNGVQTALEYHQQTFQLTRIWARKTTDSTATLQDLRLTYDAVGNATRIEDLAQQHVLPNAARQALSTFKYDAAYRLLEATGRLHLAIVPNSSIGGGTEHITLADGHSIESYTRHYDWDPGGNLRKMTHNGESSTWVHDMWISPSSNRSLRAKDSNGIARTDPESHFDPAGNMIRMDRLPEVRWDYEGNLRAAVTVPRSQGEDDAEYYVYAADGQRVRKVREQFQNGGATLRVTETIYIDGCEFRHVRINNSPAREQVVLHVEDGGDRIASVYHTISGRRSGEPESRVIYQLKNHQLSTTLMLGETGEVLSYEEFFPFGGTAFVAAAADLDADLVTRRFLSKEWDDTTGLYYYGMRYYAPWLARWLSPDPGGFRDGPNLYQYALSNPVSYVDRDGLQSEYLGLTDRVANRMINASAEEVDKLPPSFANDPNIIAYVNGQPMGTDYFFFSGAEIDQPTGMSAQEILAYADENGLQIKRFDPHKERKAELKEFFSKLEIPDEDQIYGNMEDVGWDQEQEKGSVDGDAEKSEGSTGEGEATDGHDDASGTGEEGSEDDKADDDNTQDAKGDGKEKSQGKGPKGSKGAGKGKVKKEGSKDGSKNGVKRGSPEGQEGGSVDGVVDGGGTGTGGSGGNGNGPTSGNGNGSGAGSGNGNSQGQNGGKRSSGPPGGEIGGAEEGADQPGGGQVYSPIGGGDPVDDLHPVLGGLLAMAGALYSFGSMIVDAGLQAMDIFYLGIDATAVFFTGDTLFDYKPFSSLGQAAAQHDSPTEFWGAMGRNLIETPDRLVDAAGRGDYWSFGAEGMNVYMLGRGSASVAKGVATTTFNLGVNLIGKQGKAGFAMRSAIRNQQVRWLRWRAERIVENATGQRVNANWRYDRGFGTTSLGTYFPGNNTIFIYESAFLTGPKIRILGFKWTKSWLNTRPSIASKSGGLYHFGRYSASNFFKGQGALNTAVHELYHAFQSNRLGTNMPAPGAFPYVHHPMEFTQPSTQHFYPQGSASAFNVMGAHNFGFRYAPAVGSSRGVGFGTLGWLFAGPSQVPSGQNSTDSP